jgi:hypothetical protein
MNYDIKKNSGAKEIKKEQDFHPLLNEKVPEGNYECDLFSPCFPQEKLGVGKLKAITPKQRSR